MASQLSIINSALNYLGNPSVATLDATNPIIGAMMHMYSSLSADLLSSHPWTFAMKWEPLILQSSSSPIDRFNYTWNMPANIVRVWETYPNTNYEICQRDVYSNISQDWKWRSVYNVGEGSWSDGFVRFITFSLAAESAILITENANLAQYWEQKAANQKALARYIDSQNQPSGVIQDQPLLYSFYQG